MRALLTLGLLASAAVPFAPNAAEDWQDFAMVSTTMGTQMNRLCAGADDSDIGCPSYAPSLTTAGHVSVTGNLSAVKFIGDGSELTGLTTTGDRIVSGTSSIIVSQSGHISFTTAGTARMVINASGNVGIGTTAPSYRLQINGSAQTLGLIQSTDVNSYLMFADAGSSVVTGQGIGSNGNNLIFRANGGTRMTLTNAGNVGIGTTSPGKTLDVSGTAQIVSRTIIGGTATPSATLQVSGSLLLAGSDSTTCNDAYIGILRRNPTTGRLQVCK